MCDCLVARAPVAAAGTTLFAKNSDRPPTESQHIEWVAPRREAHTATTYISVAGTVVETLRCVISRPSWCWGAEHGVNEAGVAIGNEAIYTTLDPRTFPPALIGMDLVRLGLERAASAAAAVTTITSLLEQYSQGGSGHDPAVGHPRPYWSSFLIADPNDAWIVETSGRLWQAEQVHDAAAISNRTCIPSFDAAHRHPKQPVEQRIDPRLAASLGVLAKRPVTIEGMQAHLRSHDSCLEPGWSVCMHVDGVEQTTASMIAELPIRRAPVAHMLLGSPCTHDYTRYDFEHPAI
jgi:secernin